MTACSITLTSSPNVDDMDKISIVLLCLICPLVLITAIAIGVSVGAAGVAGSVIAIVLIVRHFQSVAAVAAAAASAAASPAVAATPPCTLPHPPRYRWHPASTWSDHLRYVTQQMSPPIKFPPTGDAKKPPPDAVPLFKQPTMRVDGTAPMFRTVIHVGTPQK